MIISRYTRGGMGVRLTYDKVRRIAFDGERYTTGVPRWNLDGGYYAEQDWRPLERQVQMLSRRMGSREAREILAALRKAHAGPAEN